MPRQTLNFPSRAKRKELLKSLMAQISENPQLAQDEKYQAYVSAWMKLDEKMEALSAEDEHGVPKLLSNEEADDLAQLMLNTAQAGEEYLATANYNGQEKAAVPQMVEQYQELLAKDFGAVKAYDPAVKPLSLAELQEGARTRVIDLKGRNLGSVTNLQNQRIPMSIVDAKGQQRPGVFTKPTFVHVKGKYLDLIEEAKRACGNPNDPDPRKAQAAAESQQKLNSFLYAFQAMNSGILDRAMRGKLQLDDSEDIAVGFLAHYLDKNYKDELTPDQVLFELTSAGVPAAHTVPKAALKVLAKGLTELKDDISATMNAYQLELADGTRLDNRNVAMTAVCDMLGMGDLIARSESMKFIGDDGQVTEGTFMEYGKGIDLHQKPKLFKHVAAAPFGDVANRTRLFKQISDLQVLDYLCFNLDRHPGNIFYQIDQEGHITGIQGIDNDSSFSTTRWMASEVAQLGVIAESTKEKIMNMTGQMLRFTLRGRGLSAQELNAAEQRLRDLQDGIQKGKVKVVADDQLGRRDIKDYYPARPNASNMFLMIDEYVTKKIARYHEADKPFEPMPEQPKPTLKEVADAERRYTVGGLTDQLGKVSRLVQNDEKDFSVDDLTTRMRGSSQYFRDLVTAAKTSAALQRQLLEDQNLDKSRMLNEASSFTTLSQVNESFEVLHQRAMEYLQYKFDNTKVRPRPKNLDELTGKNPYEQSHIDYARSIVKAVSEYQQSMARPETEAEQANLQANQQRRELENRRAEKAMNEANGPGLAP